MHRGAGVRRPRAQRAWRRSTGRPTAPSRTCRSAARATPATAGARPGTEALDVYSDLKTVYVNHDPDRRLRRALRGRPDPRAGRLAARARQERPRARRPPADRLHDRRARRSPALFDAVDRLDRLARRSPRWPRATAPRCPALRPAEMAAVDLARHRVDRATCSAGSAAERPAFDLFSILRPTSPFRGAADDPPRARAAARARRRRRLASGRSSSAASTRGRCGARRRARCARCSTSPTACPTHSRQYQALPEVYVQNSSLEIAWTRAVTEHGRSPASASRRSSPRRRGLLDRLPRRLGRRPSGWSRRGEASLPAVDPAGARA